MAWFFILNGASITLKGEYLDVCETIKSETRAKATELGLQLTSTFNNEHQYTVVMMGVEISPSRSFYQGQTELLLDSKLPEEFDSLFNDVMRQLHEKHGDLYNEEKGILVSRFD
jgi:hypothetical protein